MWMFTASIAWVPSRGQGGDDPPRLLLKAYDHEEPAARADAAAVVAAAILARVGFGVVRGPHGFEDVFEVVAQLGVIACDLARPNLLEQYDEATVGVAQLSETPIVLGHAPKRDEQGGRDHLGGTRPPSHAARAQP